MTSKLVTPALVRAAWFGGALMLSVASASAQGTDSTTVEGTAAPRDGRFTMQPVDGGLLKLDTRTGAMSFCRSRGAPAGATDWVCEAVPEDRAALESEIARLQARIATLEKRGVPDIIAPPDPVPGPPPDAAPSTPPQADKPVIPEEERARLKEAMDQAMDMAEHALRRFKEMVDRLRSDPPAGERL